jgi:hypothetical protein
MTLTDTPKAPGSGQGGPTDRWRSRSFAMHYQYIDVQRSKLSSHESIMCQSLVVIAFRTYCFLSGHVPLCNGTDSLKEGGPEPR